AVGTERANVGKRRACVAPLDGEAAARFASAYRNLRRRDRARSRGAPGAHDRNDDRESRRVALGLEAAHAPAIEAPCYLCSSLQSRAARPGIEGEFPGEEARRREAPLHGIER